MTALRQRMSDRRGIALVMVLMVVTVLAALAGAFAYSMRVETKLARNASWETDLEWLGRSGIEVAKFALTQRPPQSSQFDHLGQAWAGGQTETNELVREWIGEWKDLGSGQFRVTIEDMDRRFNINTCNTPSPEGETILRQALGSVVGVEASLVPTIANSILDWMDSDNAPKAGGAETEFYERLTPPCVAKNGPIDDISELLLIQGIRDSPAMFWGRGSPPTHRQPKSARQSHFDEPVYDVGLRDLFCALSGGRLNINTAGRDAMRLIPFLDDERVDRAINYRDGDDHQPGTEDDHPFNSVGTMLNVLQVDPTLSGAFLQFLTVQSQVFQVRVQTRIGGHERTYVALLRRAGQTFPILNLIWEDK
jgi:type II secretory pathway component PulK